MSRLMLLERKANLLTATCGSHNGSRRRASRNLSATYSTMRRLSASHDSSADFSVTSSSPAVPMPELVGPTPTALASNVRGLAVFVRLSSRHPEVRALSPWASPVSESQAFRFHPVVFLEPLVRYVIPLQPCIARDLRSTPHLILWNHSRTLL